MVAGAVGAALAGSRIAAASTFTYTAPNTTTASDPWSTSANWSATPASNPATTLTFNVPTSAAVTDTTSNDIANPFQLNVLTFQGTFAAVASDTSSLNLQGNALNFIANGVTLPTVNLNATKSTSLSPPSTAGVTVANNITLSDTPTFTGNGAASFTFSGVISDAAGRTTPAGQLTKSGSSILTFSGGSSNTYTGGTLVTAGELDLNKSAGDAIPAGGLTMTGGTVKTLASSQFNTSAAVSLSGSATININNTTQTFGSLSLNGTSFLNNTNKTITITGALTDTSTSTAGSGSSIPVNSGGKIIVGGLATFSDATMVVGASSSSSWTFNGGLDLTNTKFQINSGGGTSKVILGSNVTVNASANASVFGYGSTSGALNNQLDLNNGSRTFTVADGTSAIDLLISLQITSATGTGALTKAGPGLMAIATQSGQTTPNNYTGGTTITGGTLAAQSDKALGNGNVTVSASTSANVILDLSTGLTAGAIADTATLNLNSGTDGVSTFYGQVAFGTSNFNETVGALVVDGVGKSAGTYTSANLPNFITGNGSITVAPEPGTLGMMGAGAMGLLIRRRRRRSA
jgi:autotransporter-associated beta strand protein